MHDCSKLKLNQILSLSVFQIVFPRPNDNLHLMWFLSTGYWRVCVSGHGGKMGKCSWPVCVGGKMQMYRFGNRAWPIYQQANIIVYRICISTHLQIWKIQFMCSILMIIFIFYCIFWLTLLFKSKTSLMTKFEGSLPKTGLKNPVSVRFSLEMSSNRC